MESESFLLYTEQKEVVDRLSDRDAGRLIKAIYGYAETGKMEAFGDMLDIVIIPFKQTLDRNREKYMKTVEKRREAGRLGGRPRLCEGAGPEKAPDFSGNDGEEAHEKVGFSESASEKANGFFEKQKKAKKADNGNVSVNDNDNENENVNDNVNDNVNGNINTLPRAGALESEKADLIGGKPIYGERGKFESLNGDLESDAEGEEEKEDLIVGKERAVSLEAGGDASVASEALPFGGNFRNGPEGKCIKEPKDCEGNRPREISFEAVGKELAVSPEAGGDAAVASEGLPFEGIFRNGTEGKCIKEPEEREGNRPREIFFEAVGKEPAVSPKAGGDASGTSEALPFEGIFRNGMEGKCIKEPEGKCIKEPKERERNEGRSGYSEYSINRGQKWESHYTAENGAYREKIYTDVVDYLNLKSGKNFKHGIERTRRLIDGRLKEGFSAEDFKAVIDKKCAQWRGDPDREKYLRPETLFGVKFEGYLNEKPTAEKDRGTERPKSANSFVKYSQRSYDYERLERLMRERDAGGP